MTDSTDKPSTPTGGANQNALVVNVLCVVAGIAIGVVAMMAMKGGSGFGGGGDNAVVAEFNGQSVRGSDAFGSVKTRLFELEEELYRAKEQAINDYVEQKLLEAESKKQNLPPDQLIEKEVGKQGDEVSDKDIEEFLASKNLSLNDPRIRKEDVRDYLKYRKKFDKRQTYVAKLKANAKVKLFITEPQSPKLAVQTEGFPSWGKPGAPVSVVIFSDFQCPFCSRALPTVERIKKEYGEDKVKLVFHDMPLRNHPRAMPASLAARCANDQGKFWEFHDHLFKNQTKLEDADLKEYAKTLGLDGAKFASCFESKKHESSLMKGVQEADKLGIQATPSFVINGVLLQGAQPFERFKERIDRVLKGNG